ncbi:hypothetical protein ACWC24_14200 [Streptomyces sp. NPDC001443]
MEARTYRGFNAKVTLYDDRVEIKRALTARIGGAKGCVVALADLVRPLAKPPTRLVNGYVFLATDADPAHLEYWANAPKTKIGGQRQAILFTWFQRQAQEDFLTALTEAWRSARPSG